MHKCRNQNAYILGPKRGLLRLWGRKGKKKNLPNLAPGAPFIGSQCGPKGPTYWLRQQIRTRKGLVRNYENNHSSLGLEHIVPTSHYLIHLEGYFSCITRSAVPFTRPLHLIYSSYGTRTYHIVLSSYFGPSPCTLI